MSLDIDENIKRELVHRIIKSTWENKGQLISFNINGKTRYTKSEIQEISKKNSAAFQQFSNLVHQTPRATVFNEKSDGLMWEEYQKIFHCSVIAKQDLETDIIKKNAAFSQKEAKYVRYRDEYESLESEYIKALIKKSPDNIIREITQKLKEKMVVWEEGGAKSEIERKYDEYFSRSNFSYPTLWSRWKTKALNADIAGYTGAFSRFGDFSANFSALLGKHNWKTRIYRRNTIEKLKKIKIYENNQDIRNLISNISSIKLKYQVLNIKRDWFEKEVFRSDFWKWHKSYNAGLLSKGKKTNNSLEGSLPSYISKVLFVKDIQYRSRSNVVFDFLEWAGGLFTELPYEAFIAAGKDEYFLAAYNAVIVPLCPNPDPKLEFDY